MEAVIDIKAELPENITLDDLLTFQLGIENRFSERSDRKSLEATIEFGTEPKIISPRRPKTVISSVRRLST